MNGLCQEPRRLYSRGAGCRGLAIDDHGAIFGSSVDLVRRTPTGFRALGADELKQRFRDIPEVQADPGLMGRRLSRIANALDSGALLKAQLLGLQLPFAKADAWETETRNDLGEWATGGSIGGTIVSTLRSLGLGAVEASEIEIGAGLGLSAAAGATGLVAGLVYPSGNWLTYQGTLPDHPDIDYRYDEGDLSLYRAGADGKPALFYQALPDQDGFYLDAAGAVVGRNLEHGFQIDADRITAAPADDTKAQSRAQAVEATDEPKICPAPSPDYPHGASLRAIYYQWQITGLAPGLAMEFNGHVYDGCDPETGHPLEAKGEGLARILRFTGDKLPRQWTNKAKEDVEYAGGRTVEWHFAEKEAADAARAAFTNAGLTGVVALYTPPITIISTIRKAWLHGRFLRNSGFLGNAVRTCDRGGWPVPSHDRRLRPLQTGLRPLV